MTELVIVPGTGEVLQLDSPTDELAAYIDNMDELTREMRTARNAIKDELLRRMDENLVRSFEAGDFKLECEAPNQTDYDPDELSALLMRFVAEGKITEQAMAQILKRTITYKPMKREIDKLLLAPTLDDTDVIAVKDCAKPRTRERRLTVKRA